ncbi:MAG: peptidylprolyl isomerase [Vicinamibacteria bacterium]|nr:peptidylprolyl isomerase [Vicinamibacteria bacterium]
MARVNGHDIPFAHLRIRSIERVRDGAGKTTDRSRIYREALEELVNRELLLQEAIARGIRADERRVEKAYDEKRATQTNADAWRETLAGDGMTIESFKAEIRAQLTIEALLAEIAAPVTADAVSDDEVRAFYEKNPTLFETGEQREVSQIFIKAPPDVGAPRKNELRQSIAEIRDRVLHGEDFAALARERSEDFTSRAQGGRLPPIAKGLMVEPLEKAIFELAPDQISDIIETRLGFHLVKFHRSLPSRRLAYTEVHDSLRDRLIEEKRSEAASSLIKSLRSRARIETFL